MVRVWCVCNRVGWFVLTGVCVGGYGVCVCMCVCAPVENGWWQCIFGWGLGRVVIVVV